VTGGTHDRGVPLNDVARLVGLIREQVAAEAADIRRDARMEAERILTAAEREAEGLRAEARRIGESRGRRRAAELLAIAEAEERREWLVAREELIDVVIHSVRERLADAGCFDGNPGVLRQVVREGLVCMPAGRVRVRMPPEYESLLDDGARAELGGGHWLLDLELVPVPGGGVVVETEDGELRFDNSFAARMRRERGLRRAIAGALFAEEGPAFQP
jgi:V/A-type H+-transporting ATPase subunit E